MANYKRLKDLWEKKKSHQELTDEEESELSKLERMEKLANQFDTAHNYLLEKDSFKQQDIDYAFSLKQKESEGASGEMMRKRLTSSRIYQNLMLEKIFGDMHQRFTTALQNGEITNVRDYKSISTWLDKDMNECITRKKDVMKMIFRGLRRSLKDPNEEKMLNEFKSTIEFAWLRKIFSNNAKGDMTIASESVPISFSLLMEASASPTRRLIEQMIVDSLEEQH